jgi:hypothetical protein
MSGEPNDLWPDKFEPAPVKSPEEVLEEQAQLLESKTGGIVRADVEDASVYSETEFARKFVLVAPKLRGYRYTLFKVIFPVTLYPVRFYDTPMEDLIQSPGEGWERLQAKSEQELRVVLKEILGCDRTKEIIASLMAQSEAKERAAKKRATVA